MTYDISDEIENLAQKYDFSIKKNTNEKYT
jgi:hypothetical protein